MMRSFRFLFLIVGVVLSSCGLTSTTQTTTAPPVLSPQARAYLTAALDIMQQYSVNRTKIKWTKLRQQAFVDANGAKTPTDTYVAIQLALGALGDHHSSFLDPPQAQL